MLERRMNRVGCPAGRVHIWRIQYNTVYFSILVGQVTAVNPVLNVSGEKPICAFGDFSPKDALPVSDVRDYTLRRNVETQDVGEDGLIALHVRTEDQIVRRSAVTDAAAYGHS